MKKRKIIIDCDPGHDDAIAIIMAMAAQELNVLGITTVAGNQSIDKTTNNALRVLGFINRTDIPVAAGAAHPLVRSLEIAPQVHGESGLDGPEIAQPTAKALRLSACDFMAEQLRKSAEKITLVATGPLTNVALFLSAYPELCPNIEEISIMGGALERGNWKPAAEFNIMVDPEAADIVFRSGIPLTMAGLDVTHKAAIYPRDIEKIRRHRGKVAVFVADLLDYFIRFHQSLGWDFAPLHDPCAVAFLIRPSIFQFKTLSIQVDCDGPRTYGSTVPDCRPCGQVVPNVRALYNVERESLLKLLLETIDAYEEGECH